MGTIGLPESVLRSMPLLVCTSNMGLRLLKNAGFPQPAHTARMIVREVKPALPRLPPLYIGCMIHDTYDTSYRGCSSRPRLGIQYM